MCIRDSGSTAAPPFTVILIVDGTLFVNRASAFQQQCVQRMAVPLSHSTLEKQTKHENGIDVWHLGKNRYRTKQNTRHDQQKQRYVVFGHVAILPASTPANRARRLQVDSSLDRCPCSVDWKRRPGCRHDRSVDELRQDNHSAAVLICSV